MPTPHPRFRIVSALNDQSTNTYWQPDSMDSDTIPPNAKISMLGKRTQDKKTAQCISLIRSRIEEESQILGSIVQKPSVHFVFTMNTLLNNKQFSGRLKSIAALCGGPDKIVELSCRKSGDFNHVSTARELKGLLLDQLTCPLIVICCSNTMRFEDVETLMGDMDRIRGDSIRQFGYYDELHKYIEQCRDQLKKLCSLKSVKGILGLTATPAPIFIPTDPFWSSIFFIQVDDLSGPDYCSLREHNYVLTPSNDTIANAEQRTIAYVSTTLEAHPQILNNDTYSFIPGVNVRRSHLAVRNEVWKVNPSAVVITLNTNKVMEYYDDDGTISTRPLNVQGEVGDDIANMLDLHGLRGRPLVVTGFICVGMGQSLLCPRLGTFSSVVVSHDDLTNEDIYQLVGRSAAVSKSWESFRDTRVYCPESTMQRCLTMEKVIHSISGDDYVTLDTLNKPMHEDDAGKTTLTHIRPKKAVKKTGRLGGPAPGVARPVDTNTFRLYTDEAKFKAALKDYHKDYTFRKRSYNKEKLTFYEAACGGPASITSLHDAVRKTHLLTGGKGATATATAWIPVYADLQNSASLHYMIIVPNNMSPTDRAAADLKHPSIPYVPPSA